MIAKKITLIKCIIFAYFTLTSHFVYALGTVSRACQVQEIPTGLKNAALLFFEIIGTAPLGSLTRIANLSYYEQNKYFINESLTTDYAQARYYLYAENRVRRRILDWRTGTASYTAEIRYKSSWIASSIADNVLVDPRLLTFFC